MQRRFSFGGNSFVFPLSVFKAIRLQVFSSGGSRLNGYTIAGKHNPRIMAAFYDVPPAMMKKKSPLSE